jgi:two-component system, cell cycle response regulator DivK
MPRSVVYLLDLLLNSRIGVARSLPGPSSYRHVNGLVANGAVMNIRKPRPPILIVEDHQDTLEMYAWYLLSRGCRFAEATNCPQALHLVSHSSPAVIVVDLSLAAPGACQLIRRLRTTAPGRRIPIIGLNGFGYQEYSDEALRAGCSCVLVKPCLPEVLMNEIQRSLEAETWPHSLTQSLTAAS